MNATLTTTSTDGTSWTIESTDGLGYINFELASEIEFDEDGCEEDGEEYVLIDKLEVQLAARGQGLGRQLLRAALAHVKTMGLTVRLNAEAQDADTDEEKLVAFYESEGFWISEEQGGDGVFMER